MPDLDPPTKELWAGLRSPTTRRSEIAEEVADIRADLSGYPSYDAYVATKTGYGDYESALKTRYEDVGDVTDSDVENTREDLEANISSWSDYQTGVSNQSTWDAYRSYLTSNGLTSVEADRHIQLLQLTFDPGQTFKEDSSSWSSFSDFETYLTNHGFSSSEATNFRNKVEQRFADFADFDSTVLQNETPLQKLLSVAEQITETGGAGSPVALRLWDAASIALDGTAIPAESVTLRGEDVLDEVQAVTSDVISTAAALSFSNMSLSPTTVSPLQTTTASATISNTTGDPIDEATIPLAVNDNVIDRKTISIDANGSRTIAFDFARTLPGSYSVRIGQSSTVTLTVTL